MRVLIFLGILFLPFINLAQEEEQRSIYNAPLQVGEYLVFKDKSIKFKEVISDSRCPKEVTCIWEGEAKVLVEIFKKGKFLEEKIIATHSGNVPLNFRVENINYEITSLVLLPYPTTGAKDSKKQYTLHLMISEIYKDI